VLSRLTKSGPRLRRFFAGRCRDPHTLVDCSPYGAGQQPFSVSITSVAMAVADFHAHLAHTEVIGYFGGHWDPVRRGGFAASRGHA